MEHFRKDVEAAERAMRRAKDKLNDARDRRSRIAAELGQCEDRLEASRTPKHRSREYDALRRKYDESRAMVLRAFDVYAELSQEHLDLLNRLAQAEDRPRSRSHKDQHEREEPSRRGWRRERGHSSRRVYNNSSTSRDEQTPPVRPSGRRQRQGHHHRSDARREHQNYQPGSHGARSHFFFQEHFTTAEHMPDSAYGCSSEEYESSNSSDDEGLYYTSDSDSDTRPMQSSRYERHRTGHRYGQPGHERSQNHAESFFTTEERVPRSEQRQQYDRAAPRYASGNGHAQSEFRQNSQPGPAGFTTEEHEPRSRRPSTSYAEQRERRGYAEHPFGNSDIPRPHAQAEHPTRLPSRQAVDSWWKAVNHCFQDYSKIKKFPVPPPLSCGDPDCDSTSSHRPFVACEHTIRTSFEMVGAAPKRERLRWHPDKFSACDPALGEDFKKMASEIFSVLGNER